MAVILVITPISIRFICLLGNYRSGGVLLDISPFHAGRAVDNFICPHPITPSPIRTCSILIIVSLSSNHIVNIHYRFLYYIH